MQRIRGAGSTDGVEICRKGKKEQVAQELEVIADSRLACAHALDVDFDGLGRGIRWKSAMHAKADERHDHRHDSGGGTDATDARFSHQRELIVDRAGFGKRRHERLHHQQLRRESCRVRVALPVDLSGLPVRCRVQHFVALQQLPQRSGEQPLLSRLTEF